MAVYDYRCRVCDSSFEVRRPIDAPVTSVTCPGGHTDVARIFSAVALGGGLGVTTKTAVTAPAAGGCCGGGCCG